MSCKFLFDNYINNDDVTTTSERENNFADTIFECVEYLPVSHCFAKSSLTANYKYLMKTYNVYLLELIIHQKLIRYKLVFMNRKEDISEYMIKYLKQS